MIDSFNFYDILFEVRKFFIQHNLIEGSSDALQIDEIEWNLEDMITAIEHGDEDDLEFVMGCMLVNIINIATRHGIALDSCLFKAVFKLKETPNGTNHKGHYGNKEYLESREQENPEDN